MVGKMIVNQRVEFWQHKLHLEEWKIQVNVVSQKNFPLLHSNEPNKKMHSLILHSKVLHYAKLYIWIGNTVKEVDGLCLDMAVIHELLHLFFWDLHQFFKTCLERYGNKKLRSGFAVLLGDWGIHEETLLNLLVRIIYEKGVEKR